MRVQEEDEAGQLQLLDDVYLEQPRVGSTKDVEEDNREENNGNDTPYECSLN